MINFNLSSESNIACFHFTFYCYINLMDNNNNKLNECFQQNFLLYEQQLQTPVYYYFNFFKTNMVEVNSIQLPFFIFRCFNHIFKTTSTNFDFVKINLKLLFKQEHLNSYNNVNQIFRTKIGKQN